MQGIAVADGVAMAVEGSLNTIDITTRDGEIIAAKVYVAQQVYVRTTEFLIGIFIVNFPSIPRQLRSVADFYFAGAVDGVVLHRLSVPLAVAVDGEVALSERAVEDPVVDVTRFVLCCCRQGHRQQEQE